MRYYNRSQIDQSKVHDDYDNMTSVLVTYTAKITLLQLLSFLNARFVDHGSHLLKCHL